MRVRCNSLHTETTSGERRSADSGEEVPAPQDLIIPKEEDTDFSEVQPPVPESLAEGQSSSPFGTDSSEEDKEGTSAPPEAQAIPTPCEPPVNRSKRPRGRLCTDPGSVLDQLQQMHREHQLLVREQTQQIIASLDRHHWEQMEALERHRQEDAEMLREMCQNIVTGVLDSITRLERQFTEPLSQDQLPAFQDLPRQMDPHLGEMSSATDAAPEKERGHMGGSNPCSLQE
ncbi:uncharacterized protein LOC102365275 [Latimeria chalumnae]|uniref:uncharacterized protein LOC102365275 n=1 Tax=Latimeria chalumnae TaxID=7897 RepID=UPI00313BAC66